VLAAVLELKAKRVKLELAVLQVALELKARRVR
jgi:hypothetical protein